MKSFLHFLKRNPYYTLINILGLSVALMFVILIGDYTWRQFSTDSSQPNKDRIVLMGRPGDFMSWPEESWKIGEMYPEIENTCCVMSQGGTIRSDMKSFKDTEGYPILLVDSTFFDIFSYDFIEGNPEDALSTPDRCVITESLANALFPDVDPLGEPIRIIGIKEMFFNDHDPYDTTLVYYVSGVVKDFDKTIFPNDTKIIASTSRHPQILGFEMTNSRFTGTSHGNFKTFFLLEKGTSLDSKAEEITSLMKTDIPMMEFLLDTDQKNTVTFTPLKKVIFDKKNNGNGLEKGDKGLLVILLSAVIAILIFAVTNYINLTVANTGIRAREMATRRLLGSPSSGVISKLVIESIVMVLVSFLLGLGLSFLFQDDMASMFRGRIMLENDFTPGTVCVCLCFIMVTGLLAGIIPGIQISAFKPIDIVKGSFRYKSKMVFSKAFIMLQNIITVVMLTLSLVVALQINALINAPLGINSKDILFITADEPDNCEAIHSALQQLPCVERIGLSNGSSLSTGGYSLISMNTDKNGETHTSYQATLDKEAMEIYGVEILNDYGAPEGAVYINEKLKESLGLSDSDREIQWQGGRIEQIAGVIKNFHQGNILKNFNEFKIYLRSPENIKNPDFVVKTDGSPEAFKTIKEAIGEVISDKRNVDWFVINFEEEIASQFEEDRNVLHIVLMFTGIALLISIFGFIGMSLFFIRQRRNEIAVRRIMGGSIREVILLMLTKFCAPLLLSCLIAVPLAYYISSRWLQDFSYHISLSAWIFILACMASLLIAILSVFWQTTQAVRRNPADGIKTE